MRINKRINKNDISRESKAFVNNENLSYNRYSHISVTDFLPFVMENDTTFRDFSSINIVNN